MVSTNAPLFTISALYRYAVKGLGPGDSLNNVKLHPGSTFPDDRRFALIQTKNLQKFNPSEPEWLHKKNFLCSFTDPELLIKYHTEYERQSKEKKLFSLWEKSSVQLQAYSFGDKNNENKPLLGPIDLSTPQGLEEMSSFFSSISGKHVKCITANSRRHQFGNTSSGSKHRNDTRTIHIVNTATIAELSNKIGIPLNPLRFRPNIVVSNLEPWKEFEFVGKSITSSNGVVLDVLSRTVRCDGVSVDPMDMARPKLDIPKILKENYPEYGPYLGVYAVVRDGGILHAGDTFSEGCKSCGVS